MLVIFYNLRENYKESLRTLKFAQRAKSIVQNVKPNEIMAFDENLIKRLQNEINNLKLVLNMRKKRGQAGIFEDKMLQLKVKFILFKGRK